MRRTPPLLRSIATATTTAIATTTAAVIAAVATPALASHSACPSARLGSLPQTATKPTATTAAFSCEMAALWQAVRTGHPRAALTAFFPEGAYAQLKAIADPQSDWQSRLVGDFDLDLLAAHQLLGQDAARAQLVQVQVPPTFAHWIPPGVCENRDGYWETPNARVVFKEDGVVRSFGIASMISWRGDWFVVHLGAILRTGADGELDDPAVGPGTPVPSGTC